MGVKAVSTIGHATSADARAKAFGAVRVTLKNPADPEALGNQAFVYLIERNYDAAIAILKAAAIQFPLDPRLLSDLASALLTRGEILRQPYDFVLALAAADQAVVADPELPEARFNQALALEKLSLGGQALRSWSEYLQQDPGSPWAQEAAVHLEALAGDRLSQVQRLGRFALQEALSREDMREIERVVTEFPSQARLYAEEDLGSWAKAQVQNRWDDANRALRAAGEIGQVLTSISGDPLIEESVKAIEEARQEGGKRLSSLVEGHSAYRDGLDSAAHDLDLQALDQFQQSFLFLSSGSSPFRGMAVVGMQFRHLDLGKYAEVFADSRRLDDDLLRYPSLLARSQRVAGIAHLRLGHLAEALSAYRSALALSERSKDVDGCAAAHFNIAESLRFQGETKLAWRHRLEAFNEAIRAGNAVFFHNTLFDASEAALRQGLPGVAVRFQTEMVEAARAEGDVLALTESLLRRSRTHQRLSESVEARRDLANARRWLAQVPTGTKHQQLGADIQIAEADLDLQRDPRAATDWLGDAIAFFAGRGDRFRLPELYRKRAEAFLAAGDDRRAEEDLEAGISECEDQRRNVLGVGLRISYLDQFRPVFDSMARLQVERRDNPDRAFDYAERVRARTLFDLIERGKEGPRTLSLAEVQQALPPHTALIEYSVLSDRLLVWGLTREGNQFRAIPLSKQDLGKQVRQFRSALLQRDTLENAALGRDLYDVLVGPFRQLVSDAETLILVPDGPLYDLPFAALTDPHTAHYLVREKALGYSPSATIHIRSLAREAALEQQPTARALVVGDPAFDREIFPKLKPLPGAAEEASSLVDLYDRAGVPADLLTGEAATKRAFLAAAPRYGMLHLAAHGVLNEQDPLLSALILTPEKGRSSGSDAGALYAHEIYGMHLPQTRMVVLAACWSSAGQISASEGVAGLSSAFLAAGAPVVVGTFWDVKDRSSVELLRRFHVALLRGESAAGALRKAQLSFINDSEGARRVPRLWAPFQILGGGLLSRTMKE
ncbi:MAG TPA: CHAT domain-containing protein [Thermoanaerobaculia bacterium]|nr:CHAT domain-containing protein [Thermoanaerobaculia bacterium]